MRPAYLKAALDYLEPKRALCNLLKRVVAGAHTKEIRQAVESALCDRVVLGVREKRCYAAGTLSDHELVLLHSLVLLMKPDIVVETGVAHGSSSAALLSALDKSGKGVLHSIDLPTVEVDGDIRGMFEGFSFRPEDTSLVPGYDQVGWLVPDFLKGRWHLQLGDSLSVLPDALERMGRVDIFLHDSLHWYPHMRAEFELVWPYLTDQGVLVCDDIFLLKHAAIADFSKSVGKKWTNFFGMGIVCKAE